MDKSHTVFPPEIHDVVDPYINRIEERLNNPGYEPEGQDLQSLWPTQQADAPSQAPAQTPTWPTGQQPTWPTQNDEQPAWPSQSQPGWPAGAGAQNQPQPSQQPSAQVDPFSAPPQNTPYNEPHEPNPFPYSAEVPTATAY